MNSSTSEEPCFVVGVDFGTTFTSVAFAYSDAPEEVEMITAWPNGATSDTESDQVPSVMHYSDTASGTFTWGYSTPDNFRAPIEVLKWFKLLLQHVSEKSTCSIAKSSSSQLSDTALSLALQESVVLHEQSSKPIDLSNPAETSRTMLEELEIEPVQVVEDFLLRVREVTVATIKNKYSEECVRGAKIKYVLTVPAIWSDLAKDRMIKAAIGAGYGKHRIDFDLISEPEAAAAYTLKAIQPNHLSVGGNFVVCDAGGGTVDLISYKITSLNPLKLDESVAGTGDLCGSVYLNHRFEQYIRQRLGNRTIDKMKLRSKREMFRSWEQGVKFKYGNRVGIEGYEVHVLGVPDSDEKNIEDGFHSMTNQEVQDIFDPIVDKVIALVQQQIDAVETKGEEVAAILLVGGFGSSQYLLKKLKETNWACKKNDRQIPTLQPVNARNAIARGALQRGIEGRSIVEKRRSRRFYGFKHEDIRGIDSHPQKTWNNVYDCWAVSDRMAWVIKPEMLLGETFEGILQLTKRINLLFPDFTDVTCLYSCSKNRAPKYMWEDSSSVYEVCKIITDLSAIPTHELETVTTSGGTFYETPFKLRIRVIDDVLHSDYIYNNKVYGTVSTEFLSTHGR
ncbi:hypothetical protein EDC01DRAFT_638392 [Geopyxis carbonaria]|nr:hypothetical protein EDC01DRAFT_638392 [Geopyxis carbonaria]